VPLEQFEMPQQVASAVLDAIEARGDVDAAGLLAALGVLAAEPLAGRSRAGVQRLAEQGVVSPIAAGVGMLVLIDCPDAELLVVVLRRPGAREVQAALLGIERQDTGDALTACSLTPPTPIAAVHELLSDGVHYGAAPVPIAAEELTARVLAAARRAVDAEVALGHEAGPAWVIVAHALTGDRTGLPRPAVLAPWEDDPQPIDDDDQHEDHAAACPQHAYRAWRGGRHAASLPGGRPREPVSTDHPTNARLKHSAEIELVLQHLAGQPASVLDQPRLEP
jgi:hypothetical protein